MSPQAQLKPEVVVTRSERAGATPLAVPAPDALAHIVQPLYDRELCRAEQNISLVRIGLLAMAVCVLMPLRLLLYQGQPENLMLWLDWGILGAGLGVAVALGLWVRRPHWPRWLSYVGLVLDYVLLSALMVSLSLTDHVAELGLTVETYKLLIPVALSLNCLSGVRLRRMQVMVSGICCALVVVEARVLDMLVHGAPVYIFTNVLLLSMVVATTACAFFIVNKTRGLIGEASARQAEANRVKDVLSRYISRPVADEVLQQQEGSVPLGTGRRQRVTVMFTDIRGFTSMSEQLPPEEVVAFLNTYFSRMVGAVFAFDGMLDKYMGDGMMAVFGAPIVHPDHALRALKAAVRMRQELKLLNAELQARGKPPVAIGIGLHTGECVIGNIGTEQRLDYTAIGDTVNTASRIESLTKQHGVDLLMSADTLAEVRTMVLASPVEAVTLRGRSTPMQLFALEKLRFQDESHAAPERTELSIVRW